MLDETLKDRVRQLYRRYAQNAPGFVARPGQVKMIGTVTTTLAREAPAAQADDATAADKAMGAAVCVVEGPTGTGKTLAYLLGALPVAQARKRKLVIATATVALQEQLAGRDLPGLLRACDLDVAVAVAKGRGRYVCPARLLQQTVPEHGDLFADLAPPAASGHVFAPLYDRLLLALGQGAWDGDRDSWPTAIEAEPWRHISTDARGCTGRLCSQFASCPFYKTRQKISEADVIVTNHDLLFATYRHGTDALPPQEECLFVLDEAHHLPDKALGHTRSSHLVAGGIDLVKRVEATLFQAGMALAPAARKTWAEAHDAAGAIEDLLEGLAGLRATLDDAGPLQRANPREQTVTWRFPFGQVPDAVLAAGTHIRGSAKHLAGAVDEITQTLRETVAKGGDRAAGERLLADLGERSAGLEAIVQTWDMLSAGQDETTAPMARWVERLAGHAEPEYRIAVSPISAGPFLHELLWSKAVGVVLTSATLTALGEFTRFADRAGLTGVADAGYVQLPSPFDFQRNALLEVPAMRADPRDADAHTREVAAWLNDHLDPGAGSLVLFTSYRQMSAVHALLRPALRHIVRTQGTLSKSELLAQHRADIDAGKGSVLFGVDSMAEGVDLPGRYLTHVIIAKLPFSVPSSPVHEALAEWLASLGRNPFIEVSVPDASQKLTQAVGRLIRTETDTGLVTILDKRILTRSYGRKMLAALPDFPRRAA